MHKFLMKRLLVFFFICCIPLLNVSAISTVNIDMTDPSGDVSNTNIDVVSVRVVDSTITITLVDQADFSSGSYQFILLFDENGDPTNWEAGFILDIESGMANQYWTTENVQTTNNWSDNPGSNQVTITGIVEISFFEYKRLPSSILSVIAVSGSDIDWVPNENEFYYISPPISELVLKAKDNAYQNNYDDLTSTSKPLTSTSGTSSSTGSQTITTADGFSIGILINSFLLLGFFFKKYQRNNNE